MGYIIVARLDDYPNDYNKRRFITMPRLSICIATRNRADFISDTLDNIISQATEEVEIVVVDGASKDDTEQVVRKRQTNFPQLHYLRLPINGGFDQDYNQAIELAKGDYCWLMSDDDLLKPGAIVTVLQATYNNHDFIIVNYEVWNRDYTQLLVPPILELSSDRLYSSSDSQNFFVDTAEALSYVGCVVIKRSIWQSRNKTDYFGTLFVHVGVIFQDTLPNSAFVIAQPQVATRYGNSSWRTQHFDIWMFKWPNLIWSFSIYTEIAKRQVVPLEPWRDFGTLLRDRAIGVFTIEEYFLLLAPHLKSKRERWIAYLIARFPGGILNLAYVVYILLLRPNTGCGFFLVDLKASRFYYRRYLRNIISKIHGVLNGLQSHAVYFS